MRTKRVPPTSDALAARSPRRYPPLRYALEIAAVYVAVAATWIVASDWLAAQITDDPKRLQVIQTIKGWAFVLVTGVLLGVLVFHRTRAMESIHTNLRSIFRASPLPIIALDRDGKVLSWNPAAEEVFGWTESEVLGRPDPTTQPQSIATERDRIAAGHSFSGLEVQQYRKDGTTIEVDLSMAPLRDTSGEVIGVVFITEDITGRKRAVALERERTAALEAIRAMDEALGVIGHEMRTPLASLSLMSERIADAPNAPEAPDFARAIHAEILRMTETANNMLEAARIGGNTPKWHFTTVKLADVFRDVADIFEALIDPTRVRLEMKAEPPSLSLRGDANGLRRLLINLLTNAQKHTPRGSIRVTARPTEAQGKRWIELRVEDTGEGIPADVVKAMGKAFATSSGAIGPQYLHGAGLGLTICRGIVAAHGGRIHVVTAPKRGTSVAVTLRADLDDPVTTHNPADITCDGAE